MGVNIPEAFRIDPDAGEPQALATYLPHVAQDLEEMARGRGVELTGPNGLQAGLALQMPKQALEVEMTDYLGHDKHGSSWA